MLKFRLESSYVFMNTCTYVSLILRQFTMHTYGVANCTSWQLLYYKLPTLYKCMHTSFHYQNTRNEAKII